MESATVGAMRWFVPLLFATLVGCPGDPLSTATPDASADAAVVEVSTVVDADEDAPLADVPEPMPDVVDISVSDAATPDALPDPGPDDQGLPETGPADSSLPDAGPDTVDVPPPELLAISSPGPQTVAERETLTVTVDVTDPTGATRVFAEGLPPGATWDEDSRTLHFRPDFIQGGQTWSVTLTAEDATNTETATFDVQAQDTIQPPWPTVVSTQDQGSYSLLELSQTTDAFLDSPGHAGRSFQARVAVPSGASAASPVPVAIELHGFGGAPSTSGSPDEIVIRPHDPANTYWYGYAEALPGGSPTQGMSRPYTARRVVHLLEWVLKNQPAADPERVYIRGGSMGGAGAATIGLLRARHFCYVEATIGQMVPRNHRPARVSQLSGLWGSPEANLSADEADGLGAWDHQDLTRALAESPEARDQFVFTYHGKDDPIIHFGAVVLASPLTAQSWYSAVQAERVGHYAVWDEGGHGGGDPLLPSFWSDWGWNRVTDQVTFMRRDLPIPAFSNSTADQDPGDGSGNGMQTWSDESGFAGTVSVVGDTGWSGERAGAINRFLRWDASLTQETLWTLQMPLAHIDGDGADPPQSGDPSIGNQYDGPTPLVADVTVRRARHFRCHPGEVISWEFGGLAGEVVAGADGAVTVPQLPMTTTWTTLVLSR